MSNIKSHIEEAVALLGSQRKVAEAVGCSQQYISLLIKDGGKITAEMSLALDRATDGRVSKHRTRPDIFGRKHTEATA
jgi:DNA-binding transcriptional regulator YdaS (Cro superfamily)